MSKRSMQFVVAFAAAGLGVSTADAQSEFFSRDKYEAVKDRQQPEFDPEPIRAGSLIVNADAIIGFDATDNAFAASGNNAAEAEEADSIFIASVGARARTDWSVHEIGFGGRVLRSEYASLDDESFTEYEVGASGRLDVNRSLDVNSSLTFRDGVQSRTDYVNGSELQGPIENTTTTARLGMNYRSERIRVRNELSLTQQDFEDGFFRETNTVFDQDFRDNDAIDLTTRVSYAVSPDIAVFGQGSYRETQFDTDQMVLDTSTNTMQSLSRDSKGYTISAGVDFETNNLVRGDVAIGVFSEDKKEESFEDVDGLSVDGRLQWFPSRLTTVGLTAGRRVTDNGLIDSPSTLQTAVGIEVDHEFSRQIVGTAFAQFVQDDYQEIDRQDDFRRLGVEVIYKVNKRVHVSGRFQNVNRDSNVVTTGFDPSFSANEVGLTLTFFP